MDPIEVLMKEWNENKGALADFKKFREANESKFKSLEKEIDELQHRVMRPGAGPEDTTEAQMHRKAFEHALRGDNREIRSLSVGVDADGGYGVPEDLNRTLLKLERDAVPMRQVAKIEHAQNENKEQIVSLGGATGGRVGETDARPETTSPKLGSIKPIFVEYYANPRATQKMLDDAFFDAGSWLVEEVVKTFAEYENADFTHGDGIGKPKGLLSYTLSDTPTFGQLQRITSGTGGSFDADDLITVANEGIKPGYLANASWMFSRNTLSYIYKLKDMSGRYLFDPQTRQLLGHPIVLNDEMPAVAADSKSIVFGDFKRGYWITDVRGVRVLVDPYTQKPYVSYYVTKRTGGGVLDSQALCVLQLSVI